MTNLSKELIDQELAKHNIQPNPEKKQVTDVAKLPAPTEVEKAERSDVEAKIKELQKTSTYTVKVTGEQKQMLSRIAKSAGLKDWKEALFQEITTKIFNQAISEPRIESPSWAREVTAPSQGWGNHD